jgi:hypothetical protein
VVIFITSYVVVIFITICVSHMKGIHILQVV